MISVQAVLVIGAIVGGVWCGEKAVHGVKVGVKKIDHAIARKFHSGRKQENKNDKTRIR